MILLWACVDFYEHFPPRYPGFSAWETALAVLILSANIIYKQFRLFVENARSRAAAKLPVWGTWGCPGPDSMALLMIWSRVCSLHGSGCSWSPWRRCWPHSIWNKTIVSRNCWFLSAATSDQSPAVTSLLGKHQVDVLGQGKFHFATMGLSAVWSLFIFEIRWCPGSWCLSLYFISTRNRRTI